MRKSIKGFTLVELMIVMGIFSIILGAMYAVLNMGRTSYQTGDVKITLQQEVRKAMTKITTELREASSVNLGDEYPFTIWGERIKYELIDDQLQKIVQGGTTTILANNIGDLQFDLLGGNVVYITLTAQKSTVSGRSATATLSSQVRLRN